MSKTVLILISFVILGLVLYFALRPETTADTTEVAGQSMHTALALEKDSVSEEPADLDKHPLLSDVQERMLESFGVDPATLPVTLTPEVEECVLVQLGSGRVAELKAGEEPTYADILKARSCLQ